MVGAAAEGVGGGFDQAQGAVVVADEGGADGPVEEGDAVLRGEPGAFGWLREEPEGPLDPAWRASRWVASRERTAWAVARPTAASKPSRRRGS